MLKDPLVELLVKTSTIEWFLHHMLIGQLDRTEKLHIIGQIRSLIKEAGPDPVLNNIIGWNEAKELNRVALIDKILILLSDFDLELIENADLNIEADIFLEFLVNCI